jgi:methyl-accepting chemotaxis protein
MLARSRARRESRPPATARPTLAQVKDWTAVESELKVRTDIMNVTSIVSEADKKGDILSINEKFCEVSKYSKHELIGQPHNTTRHPDMPKEVFKQMWPPSAAATCSAASSRTAPRTARRTTSTR